jgi:hypothetical protein
MGICWISDADRTVRIISFHVAFNGSAVRQSVRPVDHLWYRSDDIHLCVHQHCHGERVGARVWGVVTAGFVWWHFDGDDHVQYGIVDVRLRSSGAGLQPGPETHDVRRLGPFGLGWHQSCSQLPSRDA